MTAAQASTGATVCETEAAGQKNVLYVLVVARRKTTAVTDATSSGTPRGTVSRAARTTRAATTHSSPSISTALTSPNHWCPGTPGSA